MQISLGSLFLIFFKIGLTAFGGFMALISVVQNYMVQRKRLLKQEDMLDAISLATVLPGPVAVNVVAFVGYRLRGRLGSIISAVAVILPSFLLILILSIAYFRYGNVPVIGKFFQGLIPAVAAVILAAAWNMAVKSVRGMLEAAIALAVAFLLLFTGGFVVSLMVIAGSACLGWLIFRPNGPSQRKKVQEADAETKVPRNNSSCRADLLYPASFPAAVLLSLPVVKLFLVFGGMSLLLFGGGYVFIPLIKSVVVERHGWVTAQEFIDAIALGQVTPGPILISAAFIGYKVAGVAGAAAATIGIFGPSAVVMVLCSRILDRIKSSGAVQAVLRGIRPAVIGMIAASGIIVLRSASASWVTAALFLVSLVSLIRFKIETAWIIPAAGAVGLMLYR